MSEWIKCSDALPEQGVEVLVVIQEPVNGPEVWIASLWGRQWLYQHSTPPFPFDVVSHWMEVPEPPHD